MLCVHCKHEERSLYLKIKKSCISWYSNRYINIYKYYFYLTVFCLNGTSVQKCGFLYITKLGCKSSFCDVMDFEDTSAILISVVSFLNDVGFHAIACSASMTPVQGVRVYLDPSPSHVHFCISRMGERG